MAQHQVIRTDELSPARELAKKVKGIFCLSWRMMAITNRSERTATDPGPGPPPSAGHLHEL